ncbi:hypothetical protein [Saccharopolyspora shandongensis]|uniref:hypothetical protein n=1 Tax=Saccharopolyspora shandongensis TaxID=418495 RepID=UPI0033FF1264
MFVAEPAQVPRNRLPARELDPDMAYQIVHDELMLVRARQRHPAELPQVIIYGSAPP